jgi:Uncharacterized protein conserved in bacteria (DUF2059)
LISGDLKKDLEPALAEQTANNAIRWDRELAAHLSAAQIENLLAFYHSDVGRRYLAFQKRLIAVQMEGTSAFVTGVTSGAAQSSMLCSTNIRTISPHFRPFKHRRRQRH